MVKNRPNVDPPEAAIADTVAFAFGFQGVANPVTGSRAAMRLRDVPPIVANVPPAYTSPPATQMSNTCELAAGFQAVASPVVRSTAAMFVRVVAPIVPKAPSSR